MAKMKRRTKGLIIIGIVILLIVLLFNSYNISYYILTPEYEYEYHEENDRGVINVDGIIYKEISANMFEYIYDDLVSKNIDPYDDYSVGRMDYIFVDKIWKYRIRGRKDVERRILLKGQEAYLFNDANYPEVYFCREDILDLYSDSMTEE